MSVIILPDGTECDPYVEDCPVGEDSAEYELQLSQAGEQAAIIYGILPTLGVLYLPVYWFSVRKSKVDALTSNSIYQMTWLAIWLGHLSLYLFPAVTFPMTFAAKRGLNTIYVLWQQYMTFLTGLLLSLTVSGMFAYSYINYETESGLDQETILMEGGIYFVTTMISFIIL